MVVQAFSATPDDNDGARQRVAVNEERVENTVSEISIDGNNVVLQFADGSTMTTDMRLVTITMDYDKATGIVSVRNAPSKNESEADACYTLDGRKLNFQSSNAIVIKNGKKVIINNK